MRELVLCHHEYWDGSGYPEGRRGTEIPRAARIFCLVDSYEAIVRDDVGYRAQRDHDAAHAEMLELAGIRYASAPPPPRPDRAAREWLSS
ncbi:MAG TPA: HD domain-containing phosphohydrolase [Kofleriaceae bacterium]|nr:HD domain-containing phosphohydrolase [Kofleriaceae bacterium]